MYIAGVSWDAVPGTDQMLAAALASYVDVLWVDPVGSVLRSAGFGSRPQEQTPVPGVRRVTVRGLPGVTRPGARSVAVAQMSRVIEHAVDDRRVAAVIVANPLARFPAVPGAKRMYFATDDWLEGARLMGLSPRHLARRERAATALADVVAAVSPSLAESLANRSGREVFTLPNGCSLPPLQPPPAHADGAAFVGQMNERTDLRLVEAVVDAGVSLVIAGPLTARSAGFRSEFGKLVSRPGVRWVGQVSRQEISPILNSATVGITPYAETEFNRASFPLKTLEYLAFGLACVSTPSPSLDWLDTGLVDQAQTPAQFAGLVHARTREAGSVGKKTERRDFASHHTWDARARQTLRLIDSGGVMIPHDFNTTAKEGTS